METTVGSEGSRAQPSTSLPPVSQPSHDLAPPSEEEEEEEEEAEPSTVPGTPPPKKVGAGGRGGNCEEKEQSSSRLTGLFYSLSSFVHFSLVPSWPLYTPPRVLAPFWLKTVMVKAELEKLKPVSKGPWARSMPRHWQGWNSVPGHGKGAVLGCPLQSRLRQPCLDCVSLTLYQSCLFLVPSCHLTGSSPLSNCRATGPRYLARARNLPSSGLPAS